MTIWHSLYYCAFTRLLRWKIIPVFNKKTFNAQKFQFLLLYYLYCSQNCLLHRFIVQYCRFYSIQHRKDFIVSYSWSDFFTQNMMRTSSYIARHLLQRDKRCNKLRVYYVCTQIRPPRLVTVRDHTVHTHVFMYVCTY